jgi:hypothetical protein
MCEREREREKSHTEFDFESVSHKNGRCLQSFANNIVTVKIGKSMKNLKKKGKVKIKKTHFFSFS